MIEHFEEVQMKIRDVLGCRLVTTVEEIDPTLLPAQIGRRPTWYRNVAENLDPDPVALWIKMPSDVDFDDGGYVTTTDAVLRPGIMLSSSAYFASNSGQIEESWKASTSGVLVANRSGEMFVAVASHGFEDGGLVYHPNPNMGKSLGGSLAVSHIRTFL